MAFEFDIDAITKKVKEFVEPVCKSTGPVVNQITEKSSDLFNKGKLQTQILKLQYQITQDEKGLKQLYTEAGKLAYQNHVEGNAADAVAEQFLLIQAAEEKIVAAKDQIDDLRAKMEEIDEAAAARAAEGYACKDECCCDECEADEEAAPAEEAAAPAEEAAAPAEEAAAPAEEAAAPAEEAAAPAEEAVAPAEEAAILEEKVKEVQAEAAAAADEVLAEAKAAGTAPVEEAAAEEKAAPKRKPRKR